MNILFDIKNKKFNYPIFQNTSFKFLSQHFYLIIAPSGSGKTTLFNMLIGEDLEYDGQIYYDDCLLNHKTRNEIRKDYIGILFQNFQLSEQLNAYENVLLSANLSSVNMDNIHEEIKELFKYLNIEDCLYKDINQLSSGQKQRVAFARIMIKKPSVIICDEPTGNLDEENETILMKYLYKYFLEHECTVIVATHNKKIKSYATDILTIDNYCILSKEKKEIDLEVEKKCFSKRSYSLYKFYNLFFERHIKYYFILSLFISVCMIGVFISFNFGHTLIQQIESFLKSDEQYRTIYVYPDLTVSNLISPEHIKNLDSIEHIESITYSNDAFGRYGKEDIYKFIFINDQQLIDKEDQVYLLTELGSMRKVTKGRNITTLKEVVVSKKFLEDVAVKDILNQELKIKLPLVTKYTELPYIDEYGELCYKTTPKIVYYEDTFKVVGICEYTSQDIDDETFDIFFNESYIKNILEEVSEICDEGNEVSNQYYFMATIISSDAKYNEQIAEEVNKNFWLESSINNSYESLQYIVQEKDIFLVVEFLVYIIILYSIIKILKLSYKDKKEYLYIMQLLGCSNKDILKFYVLESFIFIGLSVLITYILNTFALKSLNQYFLNQNFVLSIVQFIGQVNFVYMDLRDFMLVFTVHIILIVFLQAFYYKKTIGGDNE